MTGNDGATDGTTCDIRRIPDDAAVDTAAQ
jgi:hypothetical protein